MNVKLANLNCLFKKISGDGQRHFFCCCLGYVKGGGRGWRGGYELTISPPQFPAGKLTHTAITGEGGGVLLNINNQRAPHWDNGGGLA